MPDSVLRRLAANDPDVRADLEKSFADSKARQMAEFVDGLPPEQREEGHRTFEEDFAKGEAEGRRKAGLAAAGPATPPARVARLAAARQFGPLLVGQKGSNPIGNFVLCWLAIAGMTGLLGLIAWLDLSFLKPVGMLLLAVMLFTALYSLVCLAAGFSAAYLFTEGLVRSRNGLLTAVPYSEIREIKLWRAGGKTALAGKLLAYYVIAQGGRKLGIQAKPEGSDPLGAELLDIARELDLRVIESGPYAGHLRP